MAREAARVECGQYKAELIQLACGDLEPGGVAEQLEAHLASCEACRQALGEWRALVGSLSSALVPEAFPNGLARKVRDELDGRTQPPIRLWLRPLRLVGVAAAAALLVATLIPSEPDSRPVAVVQSDADAAAIAVAIGLLEWGDPLAYSIDQVSASLDSIERSMKRETGTDSVLPWGPEDDWDTPAAAQAPSSPAQGRSRDPGAGEPLA
jgi:hypothetical protein